MKLLLFLALVPALAWSQSNPAPKKPVPAIGLPAGAVPPDFPKDIPIPDDAKASNALVRQDGTRRLVLEMAGRLTDAARYYQKELVARGWSLKAEKLRGTAGTLQAEKNERALAIGLFERQGIVQISIEADPGRSK